MAKKRREVQTDRIKTNIGVRKPISKEWADKVRKSRESKDKR